MSDWKMEEIFPITLASENSSIRYFESIFNFLLSVFSNNSSPYVVRTETLESHKQFFLHKIQLLL